MEFHDLMTRAKHVRDQYAAVEKKQAGRQWTVAERAQGFAGDVGQLQKLVMAKQGLRAGVDVDAKLEHELADCLWSVMILADELGMDLEQGFLKTMDELEKRTKELAGR